jgi:NADPH:quinone reductase-like Zn-dependent oxidoreductase
MTAMIIRRYGGPEVFERAELGAPRLGRTEVLVRVRGSSVNPVDTGIRAGKLSSFVRLRLPAVLGVDVAGEVVETGTESTRFSRGERVFAYTGLDRGGGYGELAALPEDSVGRVPDNLGWAEAGTVPGVGATAYEALTVHAKVSRGSRVFINGGAGGVGTYAIQIAKGMGAVVTATCSTAKVGLLSDLGADQVVDYTESDPFGTGRESYDVVLNTVRSAPMASLMELLEREGVLVTITGEQARDAGSRRIVSFSVQSSGRLLDGVAGLVAAGKVRPVVERVYTWNELAEAHRRVESGRVAGKVAVVPPETE